MKTDFDTRRRLLDTAAQLFSQRGFKNVTVRDLCDEANANVAAVNYHFGSKDGLYLAVVELAVDAMRALDREARQAGDGLPLDERLRAYVRVFLQRRAAMGSDSWIHHLIRREFSDPTDALDVLIAKGMRPRFEYLAGLVGGLMNRRPEDRRVMNCITSLQSQFLMFVPSPSLDRVYEKVGVTPPSLDEICEHIVEFSLAGILSMARARRDHAGNGQRRQRRKIESARVS